MLQAREFEFRSSPTWLALLQALEQTYPLLDEYARELAEHGHPQAERVLEIRKHMQRIIKEARRG